MLNKNLKRYQTYLNNTALTHFDQKLYGLLEESTKKKVLLDCGCNDGETTVKIARYIGASRIYGIDTDEEALKRLIEKR